MLFRSSVLFAADGKQLSPIRRDDDIQDGDCFSYFITDIVNSTHIRYKLTKRAIDCTNKPSLTLLCQKKPSAGEQEILLLK